MDHQRDFDRFCKLVKRLCDTMRGPATPIYSDELVQSWWKALRHVDYMAIENRVDKFLGNADENTKFPRPAMMRPKELTPPDPSETIRNPTRDRWRNEIVQECCYWFGMPVTQFEQVLIARRDDMGVRLKELLDDVEAQERRDGPSIGQARYVQRITADVARAFAHLRGPNPPQLPPVQAAA